MMLSDFNLIKILYDASGSQKWWIYFFRVLRKFQIEILHIFVSGFSKIYSPSGHYTKTTCLLEKDNTIEFRNISRNSFPYHYSLVSSRLFNLFFLRFKYVLIYFKLSPQPRSLCSYDLLNSTSHIISFTNQLLGTLSRPC